VPSVNGWQDLEGCLAALEQERASLALEVLVPERCGQVVQDAVAQRHPWVQHVLVPAGWACQIAAARRDGVRVVGGGVVNAATERIVDWAAFLCEYSHLMAPLSPGPAEWLTGNNTAYERALLEECRDVVETGRWEDVLHEAFRRRGVVLWCRPDIVAHHKKHYRVGEYLSQRFLYARAYAGDRVKGASIGRRVAYGLLAFGLPPVLLARIVSRIWRSGAHQAELARSLPLLVLFVTAWALGEVAGGWLGEGDALARVT
jgi:hypothetical protein